MAYDWRTRGRPHAVYPVTLPVLLVLTYLAIPISETPAWHALARDFLALAGISAVAAH